MRMSGSTADYKRTIQEDEVLSQKHIVVVCNYYSNKSRDHQLIWFMLPHLTLRIN